MLLNYIIFCLRIYSKSELDPNIHEYHNSNPTQEEISKPKGPNEEIQA